MVSWLLPLVTLCGLALAGQSIAKPWAQVVPSMVKLGPGVKYPGTDTVTLFSARGECVAAQMVAPAPIKEVQARASTLSMAGTESAAPLEPALYREAFLELREPSNIEGRPGRWPDPLIPVRDAYLHQNRRAFPASSDGPEPVVVYYEICVPQAAAPGQYAGTVVLQAKNVAPIEFPVKLKVYHFAIPATSSLATSFGFSGMSAARGHKLKTDEESVRTLTRLYSLAALRHRLSLHGMTMQPPPPVKGDFSRLDFSDYDQEVGPFLDGTASQDKAKFTSIDTRMHPSAQTDAQRVTYLRALVKHLRERGWFSRAFVYALDEPKPEQLQQLLHIAGLAHQADPKLSVLVTASIHPLISAAIDIFTPNINCLFSRPNDDYCPLHACLADYQTHRNRGKRLWWYQSCGSHGCGPIANHDLAHAEYFSQWPSYMIDHDSALNRSMGLLAFRFGIEGELYFNTVEAYLPDQKTGAPADPWTSVWRFHGHGDGTLFYPGTPDKVGGKNDVPIESLRLKYVREGLQDYEYLVLARSLGLVEEAQAMAEALALQPFKIVRSPDRWLMERQRLAGKIEAVVRARAHSSP